MFDDRSPIYRQLADQIRTEILTGALKTIFDESPVGRGADRPVLPAAGAPQSL